MKRQQTRDMISKRKDTKSLYVDRWTKSAFTMISELNISVKSLRKPVSYVLTLRWVDTFQMRRCVGVSSTLCVVHRQIINDSSSLVNTLHHPSTRASLWLSDHCSHLPNDTSSNNYAAIVSKTKIKYILFHIHTHSTFSY